jgi:hypothetical protein
VIENLPRQILRLGNLLAIHPVIASGDGKADPPGNDDGGCDGLKNSSRVRSG